MELRITRSKLDIQATIGNPADKIAKEIVTTFREETDRSSPRGRLYRRGATTSRFSKKLQSLGLKRRGKTRLVSGSKFHRASAPGQFPAKDRGRLYRDIKILREGQNRKVVFDAPYSALVDSIRPFAQQSADLGVQRWINAG